MHLFKRGLMLFVSLIVTILALALPSVNKGLAPILITRITALLLLLSSVLSFNTFYYNSISSGIGIYNGFFHVTTISQLIETFLLITGSIILISWPLIKINLNSSNNKEDNTNEKFNYGSEYSLIVLFTTLGSILLISSADLITMYLSIELQSFGLYILASLYRYSESASSAGLKYFLLGGLSSCIILLGAALIYTYTGLTNFEAIYSLLSISNTINLPLDNFEFNNYSSNGIILGIILIIIGFLFKIAAAPLHNWAPDVYNDSPTIVTIWLTIIPKIAILMFLLDLITQSTSSIGYEQYYLNEVNNFSNNLILDINNLQLKEIIKNLLLISSLLSLIIGSIVGLAQSKIKRLLAYSTISHIGFILLALAINTEQSIESFLFYIIQYTITNLNTFLILIALGYIIHNNIDKFNNNFKGSERDIVFISEIKGQFFNNPIITLSLSICLFSMAGIPPLMGFFSKQFVLYSAIQNGYYFMSIIAILVSVISASYYLKIIKTLHSENDNKVILNSNDHQGLNKTNLEGQNKLENTIIISNFHSFSIATLTLTILFFVLKPSLILNITQLLSLSIFNQ